MQKGENIKTLSITIIILILLAILAYPFILKIAPTSTIQSIDKKISEIKTTYTNTLLIPSIGITTPIIDGYTYQSLDKGAWHIPNTGNPLAGNMVIAGHRFKYIPPNNTTFYNLDKLQNNQLIYVIWNNIVYIYKIIDIFVVSPEDIHILDNTRSPTLTLYTCTPLWTANMRLVVQAILINPKT